MSEGSDAHRAAGQAIAAILHGAPIDHVDICGIEVCWDDLPAHLRSRDELLADAAIGLVGIAAASRYGFGWSTWHYPTATASGRCETEITDFIEAGNLIRSIDPDGEDELFWNAWRQAHDLVGLPVIWKAIEAVAARVLLGPIDGREIVSLFDGVMDMELARPKITSGHRDIDQPPFQAMQRPMRGHKGSGDHEHDRGG